MAATGQKTWDQLMSELKETIRKWGSVLAYRVESPLADLRARERARLMKPWMQPEQRTITLVLTWLHPDEVRSRELRLSINREDTALANLELLAKTAEHLRMAEVRHIERLVVKFYRQMYPEAPQQAVPPSPRQERVGSHGPYATLHLADDAPLDIAEAAYRAAIRSAHPDLGGSHEQSVALNAAIEAIRQAKVVTR